MSTSLLANTIPRRKGSIESIDSELVTVRVTSPSEKRYESIDKPRPVMNRNFLAPPMAGTRHSASYHENAFELHTKQSSQLHSSQLHSSLIHSSLLHSSLDSRPILTATDDIITFLCTCCNNRYCIKHRKKYPHCSRFLFYLCFLFVVTLFGGVLFHFCEYNTESNLISEKQLLYNAIYSKLDSTTQSELNELLTLTDVPTAHNDNRWTIIRAWFFAFTTASTIGYGFTAPQTKYGKLLVFVYGLPAIVCFGLSIVNIGQIVSQKIDKTLAHRKLWQSRFELKRTLMLFTCLVVCIVCGAVLLHYEESSWTIDDGMYFMWTSISTIGFGDLVPESIIANGSTLSMFFIFWGLALTAVLLGSIQDSLRIKIKKWRMDRKITVGDLQPSELLYITSLKREPASSNENGDDFVRVSRRHRKGGTADRSSYVNEFGEHVTILSAPLPITSNIYHPSQELRYATNHSHANATRGVVFPNPLFASLVDPSL